MSGTSTPKYIHGYQEIEQERLREQALVIERPIYDFIDFSEVKELLEIGSGVGAQTEILLRKFPHLSVTGVEYESRQIAKAKENMTKAGFGEHQVRFVHQDAKKLNLDQQYDGAFICWVLEHIPDPIEVLISMKPFLKPGAKISITEVFNATFYTFPVLPAIMDYWKIYNDYQVQIGGDPQSKTWRAAIRIRLLRYQSQKWWLPFRQQVPRRKKHCFQLLEKPDEQWGSSTVIRKIGDRNANTGNAFCNG